MSTVWRPPSFMLVISTVVMIVLEYGRRTSRTSVEFERDVIERIERELSHLLHRL